MQRRRSNVRRWPARARRSAADRAAARLESVQRAAASLVGGLWMLTACCAVACGGDVRGLGPESGGDSGLHDGGGPARGPEAASGSGSDASVGSSGNAGTSSSGGDGGGSGAPGTASIGSGGSAMTGADGGMATASPTLDASTGDAAGGSYTLCGTDSGMCPKGLQCDPTMGCVTCTMDSQCAAATRFCLLGSCVQCKTNTDCAGGTTPSCWPATHTCHAACTTNQQCSQDGTAPICNTTTGACVGCISSADCPASQRLCDPTSQQCVQCVGRADCAGTSTPACLQNRCVACATNADCSSATPYCASGGDSAPRCVQCVQNAQCPPSAPSCNGGTCGRSSG